MERSSPNDDLEGLGADGRVNDEAGEERCFEASGSIPQTSTEKTPLLKATPVRRWSGSMVHSSRHIDPLDAARNRLDNPYQDVLNGSIHNSTVNSHSASQRAPPNGSTVWDEGRIDDNVLPPTRTLKKGATSNTQTMMHIFKGNIGTGILAMPYAFSNGGLWAGFVGTSLIALIAIHCMRLLVESSHHLCHITGKETLDYGYCMDYAFKNVTGGGVKTKKTGRWMRKLVNLSLQITQFGFCCVYFVFMADNLAHVVNNHVYGSNLPGVGLQTRVYMSAILPFVLALCCMRSVRKLSYFSMLANFLCLTGLILVIAQLFRQIPSVDSVPAIEPDFTKWPLFLATTIYTFEGIGVILPLENKMKNPQAFLPWNGVLNTAMVISCCFYLAVGFFGFLKYGKDCAGSITLNLPANSWMNDAVRIMFSVAMYASYALQFYVPVEIIWPILRKRVKKEEWKKPLERIFRCFLVLCTFAIAIAIPHLGPFISLIGAFASSSLALLFPVLIDTLVRWPDRLGLCNWRLFKNIFIFTFGLVGFFFGTWQSINEIVAAFEDEGKNSTVSPPTTRSPTFEPSTAIPTVVPTTFNTSSNLLP